MKEEILDALLKYIDLKVEYEKWTLAEDEEGYLVECGEEKKAMEKALEELRTCNSQKG